MFRGRNWSNKTGQGRKGHEHHDWDAYLTNREEDCCFESGSSYLDVCRGGKWHRNVGKTWWKISLYSWLEGQKGLARTNPKGGILAGQQRSCWVC